MVRRGALLTLQVQCRPQGPDRPKLILEALPLFPGIQTYKMWERKSGSLTLGGRNSPFFENLQELLHMWMWVGKSHPFQPMALPTPVSCGLLKHCPRCNLQVIDSIPNFSNLNERNLKPDKLARIQSRLHVSQHASMPLPGMLPHHIH